MVERTSHTAAAERAPNGWPQAMLAGFRAGEREALRFVYRAHAREVATFLRQGFSFDAGGQRRRFVGYGSAHELQDILHETFTRAFEERARQGYDGIRPYGPYLLTIARNLVLRSFRARELAFPPEAMEGALRDTGRLPPVPDPEQALAHDRMRELVAAFVARLPEQQQALVRARYEDGLSERDAAAELGCSRQQVRTMEKSIRRELLGQLRERADVLGDLLSWPLVLGALSEVLR